MNHDTVYRLIGFSFFALLLLCLSMEAKAEKEHFLTRLDRDIFEAIYDTPPQREPLHTIMEGVTEFGDNRTMVGLSMLLMAYGDDKGRETGRLMSSAFIGTGILVFGIKETVRRKRPLDEQLGNPAFPSGHTAYAFATATILSQQYPRWRVPLYISASLVGLSRIYLGRHYASDVLAGASLGTVAGLIVWNNRLRLLRWEF